MGFKCGIVGLPNVGKSTLFNALTQTAAAQAANYPFCTIEPNVGDVAVPDPRLEVLAEIASLQGDHPDAADLRRHRRPGARRLEGRGARQPVPRQHPRMRRDRACRALLRRRRRHPCRRPDRSALRHRDDRDRIDARRPRQPRTPRPRDGEEGQGRRQGGQGTARPRAAQPRGTARGPARPRRWRRAAKSRSCSPRSACCRRSPCSMSATSRRPRRTRATPIPTRFANRPPKRARPASSSRPRSRARSRCCRATTRRIIWKPSASTSPASTASSAPATACCIW